MQDTSRTCTTVAVTALAVALAGCAAGPRPVEVVGDANVVSLADFSARPTDGLWSADRVIGLPVRGADGEEIGEIDNLIVGPDDRLRAAVVQVGGFLDVGGTRLRVPWDEVTLDSPSSAESVAVPFTADDYTGYTKVRGDGAERGAGREWRADELIGDYVSLDDAATGEDYGTVSDLMFTGDGALDSVVVNRSSDNGGGFYNYPYRGYGAGFDPGLDSYRLGYGAGDVDGYAPFDYTPYGRY